MKPRCLLGDPNTFTFHAEDDMIVHGVGPTDTESKKTTHHRNPHRLESLLDRMNET